MLFQDEKLHLHLRYEQLGTEGVSLISMVTFLQPAETEKFLIKARQVSVQIAGPSARPQRNVKQ